MEGIGRSASYQPYTGYGLAPAEASSSAESALMAKAAKPEKFSTCLFAAIATLCAIYTFFGELTAFTFGQDLTEPFITEMLPG